MKIASTSIPGCYELKPRLLADERGLFVKTFHKPEFSKAGLELEIREQYYWQRSHERVLRGLHFQAPPKDCVKLVYCVAGSVFDTVLDLRVGSTTFGKHATFRLSSKAGNAIYLSKGFGTWVLCAQWRGHTGLQHIGALFAGARLRYLVEFRWYRMARRGPLSFRPGIVDFQTGVSLNLRSSTKNDQNDYDEEVGKESACYRRHWLHWFPSRATVD